MQSHGHNRPARRKGLAVSLSPEQLAERHEQALRWREAWRAEMAGDANGLNGAAIAARPPQRGEKSAARFASGIARAEFGRFYWKGPTPGASKPKPAKKADKTADKPKRR